MFTISLASAVHFAAFTFFIWKCTFSICGNNNGLSYLINNVFPPQFQLKSPLRSSTSVELFWAVEVLALCSLGRGSQMVYRYIKSKQKKQLTFIFYAFLTLHQHQLKYLFYVFRLQSSKCPTTEYSSGHDWWVKRVSYFYYLFILSHSFKVKQHCLIVGPIVFSQLLGSYQ